jgi:hypothetical protein
LLGKVKAKTAQGGSNADQAQRVSSDQWRTPMPICLSLKRLAAGGVLLAVAVAYPGAAPFAAARAAPARTPAISAEARSVVAEMGKTLLAKEFSFHATTLRVYRAANGQPLHIGHRLEVTVRRPDRLLVQVIGDDGKGLLAYDGKTTYIFRPETKKYVAIPSPDTIEGMLKKVMGQFGVDFPLADLITNAPDKSFLYGVRSGRVVDTVTIGGTPCLHLVFDQPGMEIELWVEKGERTVPRRLIITYYSLPDRPNFIAALSDWKFDVHPANAAFEFHPPSGARQVQLEMAPKIGSGKRKGM